MRAHWWNYTCLMFYTRIAYIYIRQSLQAGSKNTFLSSNECPPSLSARDCQMYLSLSLNENTSVREVHRTLQACRWFFASARDFYMCVKTENTGFSFPCRFYSFIIRSACTWVRIFSFLSYCIFFQQTFNKDSCLAVTQTHMICSERCSTHLCCVFDAAAAEWVRKSEVSRSLARVSRYFKVNRVEPRYIWRCMRKQCHIWVHQQTYILYTYIYIYKRSDDDDDDPYFDGSW